MKQKLTQKLTQKLNPQQIQLMSILQLPITSLENRIKKELEDNPILEEEELNSLEHSENDENIDITEYIQKENTYQNQKNYSKNDSKTKEFLFDSGFNYQETLSSQLKLLSLSPLEQIIGEYIIGNIDETGYLKRDLLGISDDIAFTQYIEVNEQQIEKILFKIQNFDPPGIGARNLQECLLLQLNKKKENTKEIQNAIDITSNHFDLFTKKHYDKIGEKLNLTDIELKKAIKYIIKLNPKPGAYLSELELKNNEIIIPDFLLTINQNKINVQLNNTYIPKLKINNTYINLANSLSHTQKSENKNDAIQFIKQKIDSAKWFIEAIKQRNNTLLKTIKAIIKIQEAYFLTGDESKIVSMILKDIAKYTQLDISTISRITNSKYIQTPYGTFLIKKLFSESLQNIKGEDISSIQIKSILKDIVKQEDKSKPLTDEKLVEIFTQKGFKIARRTIAKYREKLNIPVARLRKEI